MELSRSGIYNRLLLPFLWVVKTSQTKVSQFDLTSAQIGTDNIKKKKKNNTKKSIANYWILVYLILKHNSKCLHCKNQLTL